MINDKNIAWNRKRVFVKAADMMGVLPSTGVGEGAGAVAFIADPLAASELTGAAMGAAGDELYDVVPIPWDMDIDQPMRVRLWFTHSTTTADTPDWLVSLKAIAKQAAVTDAASTPDQAVAFAAKAVSTTASALEILDWEVTTSDTWIASTDRALLVAVECNGLGSASADEIVLYGYELEYTVKACGNDNIRSTTANAPVAS